MSSPGSAWLEREARRITYTNILVTVRDLAAVAAFIALAYVSVMVGRLAKASTAQELATGKLMTEQTLPKLTTDLDLVAGSTTSIADSVGSMKEQVNALLKTTQGIALNVKDTTAGLHDQEVAEIALLDKTQDALGKLVGHADDVTKELTPTVVELRQTIVASKDAIETTKTAVSNLNQSVATANQLLADPNLPKSLANIQEATFNAASSTKQIDTSLRVDILPYVHRLTKPAKAVWVVLKEAGHDVSAGIGGFFGTHGF